MPYVIVIDLTDDAAPAPLPTSDVLEAMLNAAIPGHLDCLMKPPSPRSIGPQDPWPRPTSDRLAVQRKGRYGPPRRGSQLRV